MGAVVPVYRDRQTWIKVYLCLLICGSTWDEGPAFFRPCADGQRQYQDAPLGWIWPINVDRVHLVSAKEIVCLWLCVFVRCETRIQQWPVLLSWCLVCACLLVSCWFCLGDGEGVSCQSHLAANALSGVCLSWMCAQCAHFKSQRTFSLRACNTITSVTGPEGEAGLQCHTRN